MRAHRPTPRRRTTPTLRPGATATLAAAALTALLAAPTVAHAATSSATSADAAAVTSAHATADRVPATVISTAARAGTPVDTRGLRGPVVTHPVEQSFDYPAGEVCAFPSHADFPVSDLTTKTWTDAAGNPVIATETGPLIMKVTNLDNGKSVVRDISGDGVITYPDYPSADTYVLSGNDWGAGFHTADRPAHNRWIIASTFMSVKISVVDGKVSRQLLALGGPYEDLCKTLA